MAGAIDFSFEWLLHPTPSRVFLNSHWQKMPLHISNRGQGYFQKFFTIDRFEAELAGGHFHPDVLRLFDAGERLPVETYLDPSGRPRMRDLFRLFAEGKTINYYIHYSDPKIASLCRDVETKLHFKTKPALFLTPREANGLGAHYDYVDIFVLQLWGKKTWRLFEPVFDSPIRDQDRLAIDKTRLGEPVLEAELQCGDVLYLPRGYIHEPFTTDEPSLHLSLGITFFVWYDLLKEILERAVSGDALLRQPIPSELLKDPDSTGFDEVIGQALAVLQTHAKTGPAVRKLLEGVYLDQPQHTGGQFRQLARLAEIGPETLVVQRDVATGFVADGGEIAELVFSGDKLTGPGHLAPILRDIAARKEPFRPVDLVCSLNEKSRLVLIRKLVQQGYLKIAAEA